MIDGYFYGIESGECAFFRAESVHSISAEPDSRIAVAQFEDVLSPVCCLKKPIFKDISAKISFVICTAAQKLPVPVNLWLPKVVAIKPIDFAIFKLFQ